MKKVLITGAGGQLGSDMGDVLSGELPLGAADGGLPAAKIGRIGGYEVVRAAHDLLDITERSVVMEAVSAIRPDVIVHAAAYTRVDDCEHDQDAAFAVNAVGTRNIAEAARRYGAYVTYVSTDYVFDGSADRPYVEWDVPCPVSVYGRSKLGGEMELDEEWSVVRTSWLCGARGGNFVKAIMGAYREGKPLKVVNDQRGCPTVTSDLAVMLGWIATERLPGVFHVTNRGAASWWDVAGFIVRELGGDPDIVRPITTAELDPPRAAPRPANSVLDNMALRIAGMDYMPDWQDGIARLVRTLED